MREDSAKAFEAKSKAPALLQAGGLLLTRRSVDATPSEATSPRYAEVKSKALALLQAGGLLLTRRSVDATSSEGRKARQMPLEAPRSSRLVVASTLRRGGNCA